MDVELDFGDILYEGVGNCVAFGLPLLEERVGYLTLPYYLLTWELDLLRVLMKGNVVASVFLNEDIHDTKRLLNERVKRLGIK